MGFGQYCLNCHASARDNQTFASPDNIMGQSGSYLSFLSQDFYQTQSFGIQAPVKGPQAAVPSEHLKILAEARMPTSMSLITLLPSSHSFLSALNLHQFAPISQQQAENTLKMPSQTYDNVWVAGGGPKESHAFLTSDQCVGCHSTGDPWRLADAIVDHLAWLSETPERRQRELRQFYVTSFGAAECQLVEAPLIYASSTTSGSGLAPEMRNRTRRHTIPDTNAMPSIYIPTDHAMEIPLP